MWYSVIEILLEHSIKSTKIQPSVSGSDRYSHTNNILHQSTLKPPLLVVVLTIVVLYLLLPPFPCLLVIYNTPVPSSQWPSVSGTSFFGRCNSYPKKQDSLLSLPPKDA